MNNEIIPRFLFWGIFYLLFHFAVRILFINKRASAIKPLLTILSILIFGLFIPAVFGTDGQRHSIFQFAISGSLPFAVMTISYIAAFLLLLKKDPNFDWVSAIVYFVGHIASWFGLLSKDIPQQMETTDNLQFAFIFLYYVVAIATFLPYIGLIVVPTQGKKRRLGIFKFLEDWGSNRPLLRKVARKFSLSLDEGSGWKQAVASGKVDGFLVKLETDFASVTYVPVGILSIKILLNKTLSIQPTVLYKRKPGKEYWEEYEKLAEKDLSKNIKIKSENEDISILNEKLGPFLPTLEKILNKDKYLSPPWIEFNKDFIRYRKHSIFNYDPHLSPGEVENIVQALIKIAGNF